MSKENPSPGILRVPKVNDYEKSLTGFKTVPESEENQYQEPKMQKVITESMSVKEVVFDRIILPEWLVRIKQCIKDTKIEEKIYRDKVKRYSDIIH